MAASHTVIAGTRRRALPTGASLSAVPSRVSTIRYSGVVTTEMPPAGLLLRQARQRAGLSQVELARRAGVAQSVISAYECGTRQPALPTLTRLVAAAGFELDMHMSPEPPPPRHSQGPLGELVQSHRDQIRLLAAEHGVERLRLFGSVARREEGDASDIDFLVDLPSSMGLLGLARLQRELEKLLLAPVDLIPEHDLKPTVREKVQADLVPL